MRAVLFIGALSVGCSTPNYTFEDGNQSALDASSGYDVASSEIGLASDTKLDTVGDCTKNADCPQGQFCHTGSCVAGCKDDADCMSSAGDAGVGAVVVAKCDPGTHTCSGCKSDTACPWGYLCKPDGVCRAGCNSAHACPAGITCCGGACINTTEDTANCGGCGTPCTIANGAGACVGGRCKVTTCNAGFGDCDGSPGNGCEINFATNIEHCGSCSVSCSGPGTPACVSGVCKSSICPSGFGDCTGAGACTTALTNNVNNCGGCGLACAAANATPACSGTTCSIGSCNAGFGDCNSKFSDGCEQRLDTLSNCGACGNACELANATASCSTGACELAACNANYGNCDGDDENGCEQSLLTDASNCGACGNACTVTNGTSVCNAGACKFASCNAGYADCDSNAATCERDLTTASNSCGAAQWLKNSSGSDLCGSGVFPDTVTTAPGGTRYYRIRLVDAGCSGSCDPTSKPLRAQFTLKNPAGAAYDLRVFSDGVCSALAGSSTTGLVGGTETVTYKAPTCDARDLWIEVKYRAGASCSAATLTVNTAYKL